MKPVLLYLTLFLRRTYAAPTLLTRQYTPGQVVNTTSGPVQGTSSTLRSNVSAYLGIPYAQPPVGNLRFAPPQPYQASSSVINATAFGPDCPCNRIPTTEAFLGGPAGSKILIAEAQTGDAMSEDCLTLNVWTKPQTGETKKAVLFWIYGGGFSIGNTACPIYDGAVLADEQDVVVMSPNYRLNVFGFSGAPGTTPNVGLWDQRRALEWARDNVAAFGGDPDRITVFGQSAGGASVDYMSYNTTEPIAHAFIPQSGVANSVVGGGATQESFGVRRPEAGEATVACVRTKTTDQILAAISPIAMTAIDSGFEPIPDDVIVPSDIPTRGEEGDFAHLPYLTGNTDDEAAFFLVVALAYTNLTAQEVDLIPVALIQPVLDLLTLAGFTCPAAQAAGYRQQNGVPVWRYRYYGGNYTNTYIDHVGSAYHTSELPIVFATASSVTGIPDTTIEAQAAAYMRQTWATFARDPVNGLTGMGWPQYNPSTVSEVRLSYDNETSASYIPNLATDTLCPAVQSIASLLSALTGMLSNLGSLLTGGSTSSEGQWLLNILENIQSQNLTGDAAVSALITALQQRLNSTAFTT